MIQSSKPRNQRKFRFTAKLHQRQHFLHAHVDKSLRQKTGLKQRAVQISRGDTVKVMSGSKRGTSGNVTRVSLRTGRIFIDSLMKKNAKGKEFNIGISANNVYITALNLTDKIRAAKLKLQQQKPAPKVVEAKLDEKREVKFVEKKDSAAAPEKAAVEPMKVQ